ncbi:helix-turn-helix domain-containing protein [Leifsonia sp. NPDC058292]|uniref:helix-turn-helix domain-containing protein n=1 Tax=Leifsonia sp. NPDC058292 TaxID=3346428 RepID=UPI0036DD76AA
MLALHGGVRPRARARGKQQLTVAEREGVSRGIAAGLSSSAIAAILRRSPSTVSREIARNGGRQPYRADLPRTQSRSPHGRLTRMHE